MSENNIELRSEEVQEIIGRSPAWLIKYGILCVFFVLTILILGSLVFTYPNVVTAEVTVTTETPPAELVAKRAGTIDSLLLGEGQFVQKGQLIAYLKNPLLLGNYIKMKTFFKASADSLLNNPIPKLSFTLGDLNSHYEAFQKAHEELYRFLRLGFYQKQIEILKKKRQYLILDLKQKKRQMKLQRREALLSQKRWRRDSLLFLQGVIAKNEVEQSEETYISSLNTYESSRSALINIQLQTTNLEHEILNMQLEYPKELQNLTQNYYSSYKNINNTIVQWEEQYLFIAPISGYLSFSSVQKKKRNLVPNDKAFSVVPRNIGKMIGQLKLPFENVGKVQIGQKVNVKFSSFPYMEYGIVNAKLQTLSAVPEEEFYYAELTFPDSLTTNYNKPLQFRQGMKGSAEIITEEQSFLFRLIAPLRYIFEK